MNRLFAVGVAGLTTGLVASYHQQLKSYLDGKLWDKTPEGKDALVYTLKNKNGLIVEVSNYGGTITKLITPDKQGKFADIVLGFNKIEDYLKQNAYLGCLVGRYCNRIANGKFTLQGKTYNLPCNNFPNNKPNCLHGGIQGFSFKLFKAQQTDNQTVKMSYLSKDMEEGFPGNLNLQVTYSLLNTDELKIDYKSTTDKPTVLNLTNHSYFNLKGEGNGTILDHELQVNSSKITKLDSGLIPTGEYKDIKGTALDFTKMKPIGKDIEDKDENIKIGSGYDVCYVFKHENSDKVNHVAQLYEKTTGRTIDVYTSEPGLQIYSGNWLESKGLFHGKSGKPYLRRGGFCLETQHFADSPNKPHFPSVVLLPGQELKSTTIYRFGVKKN